MEKAWQNWQCQKPVEDSCSQWIDKNQGWVQLSKPHSWFSIVKHSPSPGGHLVFETVPGAENIQSVILWGVWQLQNIYCDFFFEGGIRKCAFIEDQASRVNQRTRWIQVQLNESRSLLNLSTGASMITDVCLPAKFCHSMGDELLKAA